MTFTVKVCESFSMQYTGSCPQSRTKHEPTRGYYLEYRFHLYSIDLKKQFGKEWRTTCEPTLKGVAAAKGGRPTVPTADDKLIDKAIARLLSLYAGQSCELTKHTSTREKTARLDDDELAVFWMTNYPAIAAFDKSSRTDSQRQLMFAKVCRQIGSFRLSRFAVVSEELQKQACEDLVSGIKKALGKDASAQTWGISEVTQVVRYALTLYFEQQNIHAKHIMDYLISISSPPKSIHTKIADNMRPQALPLEVFRKLYHTLAGDNSSTSKALQLMLLLGLTAEEACGLSKADVRSLPCFYHAVSLCISHIYHNSPTGFCVENNTNAYRNIPLPYPLSGLFYIQKNEEEKNVPLFTNQEGNRLNPIDLDKALHELLEMAPNKLVYTLNGKQKTVDLAFLQSSYRSNCRAFWKEHCGLDEGEIRYLGGLEPQDTLSAHYIDYDNVNQQYRMLKQMEHGIALLARTPEATSNLLAPMRATKNTFFGDTKTRVGVLLSITKPVKLEINSWRGVHVEKGVAPKDEN